MIRLVVASKNIPTGASILFDYAAKESYCESHGFSARKLDDHSLPLYKRNEELRQTKTPSQKNSGGLFNDIKSNLKKGKIHQRKTVVSNSINNHEINDKRTPNQALINSDGLNEFHKKILFIILLPVILIYLSQFKMSGK